MTVHRLPVPAPERDHVCRDCGQVFAGLAWLADHYATVCVGGFINPRRGGATVRRSNRYTGATVQRIGRRR